MIFDVDFTAMIMIKFQIAQIAKINENAQKKIFQNFQNKSFMSKIKFNIKFKSTKNVDENVKKMMHVNQNFSQRSFSNKNKNKKFFTFVFKQIVFSIFVDFVKRKHKKFDFKIMKI